MILQVTRGYIKVKIGDRTATIQGEMFFPGNDKVGFALYRSSMKYWDSPNGDEIMTIDEKNIVISDIQAEFSKGGHMLEID